MDKETAGIFARIALSEYVGQTCTECGHDFDSVDDIVERSPRVMSGPHDTPPTFTLACGEHFMENNGPLATEKAREAAALDLYVTFEKKHSDHFTAQLYRLIAKGDPGNRRRLEYAFPLHVAMYIEWMNTPDRHTFYEKYNCVANYTE